MALDLPPFTDAQGHVVLAGLVRHIPDHRSRGGLHIEFATFALHLVGLDESFDGQAIEARTGNEVVGEGIAIGVKRPRIVFPTPVDASILDGRSQQDGAVVVARLWVDDQHARDAEWHVDRTGDVEDPGVAVRVLHDQVVDPGTGKGVGPLVDVEAHLPSEELSGVHTADDGSIDPGQAVHLLLEALIPPHDAQPGPVRHDGGLGVGGHRDLIGRSRYMAVCDLPGPVVRGTDTKDGARAEEEQG